MKMATPSSESAAPRRTRRCRPPTPRQPRRDRVRDRRQCARGDADDADDLEKQRVARAGRRRRAPPAPPVPAHTATTPATRPSMDVASRKNVHASFRSNAYDGGSGASEATELRPGSDARPRRRPRRRRRSRRARPGANHHMSAASAYCATTVAYAAPWNPILNRKMKDGSRMRLWPRQHHRGGAARPSRARRVGARRAWR